MATHVIYTRASRADLRYRLALIPRILAGRAPDRLGIAHGFRMRLAVAFLEKVKLAFITKSRGGTDEAGITWPPLSRRYLAYGRRFARGEQAALKKAAGLGKGNRYAPGGQKGLLTAEQLKRWRQVYARNLAWLAAKEPFGEAKAAAAAIAWNTLKREGAQTKLDVFGNREADILRDTGVLFNSLSPGSIAPSGADASYTPPPNQVVQSSGNELLVGTNVPYAAAHQYGKRTGHYGPHATGTGNRSAVRRQLWPEADEVPPAWLEYFSEHAAAGIPVAVELLAKGAA